MGCVRSGDGRADLLRVRARVLWEDGFGACVFFWREGRGGGGAEGEQRRGSCMRVGDEV